jgi:uncharacterized membrane protein YqiK
MLYIVLLAFSLFYIRPKSEQAFIRTGVGGEKVIFQSGLLVLPGLHRLTEVSLLTHKFDFPLEKEGSLLLADHFKTDVTVSFLLRVAPTSRAIAIASRTLGEKTFNGDILKKVFDSVLESAIRKTLIKYTMEELHKLRDDIEHELFLLAESAFCKNGLEVVLVSVSKIRPTDKDFLDTDDIVDVQALQQLEKFYADSTLALQQQKLSQEMDVLKLEQQKLLARLKMSREKFEKEAESRRDLLEMDLANQLAMKALYQEAKTVDKELGVPTS